MVSNNTTQMKVILEAALLTSSNPLSLDDMLRLFSERIERATLRMLLDELRQDWQSRDPISMELVQVASGWRFQALPKFSPYLSRLNPDRPQRYSRAAMETLAIIAYRQPVTRGDIEELRGVAVNPNTIRQLQERDWIDVVGQRDVPGRPSLYSTTKTFLDDLNLKSLAELPEMETFIEQPFAEEPIVETSQERTTQVDFLGNGESPAN
ncbi:MAG: SMC-Scp complex subunit ScpB [Methylophilaceae bacterium]|nr:SMC-Scp complex subunit ScpB [Methylophilaceae bacterium]